MMSNYDNLYDEHPAPPGTSSVWVSSNRVTVTGHQPAAVPASQHPWVPPHGSVPSPYGCMQYHGPPPPVYNYGHSRHHPYPPQGYSLPYAGSQRYPPASSCMRHPPPPVNQPQLPSYPPPASTPIRVKDPKGRGVGKKSLPVSIPLSAPGGGIYIPCTGP